MILNVQNSKFTPKPKGYTLDDQHNITTEAGLNVTGDLKVKSKTVATTDQISSLQNTINNINTTDGAQTSAINTNASNITNLQTTTVRKDNAGNVNITGNLTVQNEQVGLNKDIISNTSKIDNLTSIVRPVYRIINDSNDSNNYNIQVIKGEETQIQLNPGLYQIIAVGRGGSIFDNYFGFPGEVKSTITKVETNQQTFNCYVYFGSTEVMNTESTETIISALSGDSFYNDSRQDAINYYYNAYKEASASMITGLPYFGTVGGKGPGFIYNYSGTIDIPIYGPGTVTANLGLDGSFNNADLHLNGEVYNNQTGSIVGNYSGDLVGASIQGITIDIPMFYMLQSAPGPCGLGGGQIFIPYQDSTNGSYMTSVPGDGGVIIIPIEYYN